MKVLVNHRYGGFSVSKNAVVDVGLWDKYKDNYSDWDYVYDDDLRYNKDIIKLLEEKGSEYVSGGFAELSVVNIPDEATDYKICEYDGIEWVMCVIDGKLVEI